MPLINRRNFVKASLAWPCVTSAVAASMRPTSAANKHPYILRIICEGGWDPVLVFDDKLAISTVSTQPNSQTSSVGKLKYIDHPDRPEVADFFSDHAAKSVIINGIFCQALDHRYATEHSLSISDPFRPYLNLDFLAYYADKTANRLNAPYVVLEAPTFASSLTPLTYFLNDDILTSYLSPLPGSLKLGAQAESRLQEHLELAYETELLLKNPMSIDSDKVHTLHRSILRESSLANHLAAINQQIDPNDSDTLRRAKFALHMFGRGLSKCATIRHSHKMAWNVRRDIFDHHSSLYNDLFAALRQIIASATTLGLQNDLIIIVSSELGRSPKLNSEGSKDLWPYTSALVWGKGVNGPKVVGKTDQYMRGIPMDPVFGSTDVPTVEVIDHRHVYAAIFLAAGIDYSDFMPEQSILSEVVKV